MNSSFSEIAFVLDRSGSMETIRQSTIEGFNSFLKTQQESPGTVKLTLNQFDTEQLLIHDAVPVGEIEPLSSDTCVPRGATALLDAIGDTIDRLKERLDAMTADQKPATVTVAILTDGQENSSVEFTWKQVSAKIQERTKENGWEFLFLGADADTIATAGMLSIDRANTSRFSACDSGVNAVYSSMSRKITSRHMVAMRMADEGILRDSDTPMEELLAQEEERLRRSEGDGSVA